MKFVVEFDTYEEMKDWMDRASNAASGDPNEVPHPDLGRSTWSPRPPKAAKGTPPSETGPGRAIMSYFDSFAMARGPELARELMNAGYAPMSWCSVVHRLVEEGCLVRTAQGRYRRASEHDQLKSARPNGAQPGPSA